MQIPAARKGPLAALGAGYMGAFRFHGRASRSELAWFWGASLLVLLLGGVLHEAHTGGYPFAKVTSFLLGLPIIPLVARRLHDIGHSGWWSLLLPVPLVGLLGLLYLVLRRGVERETRYDRPGTFGTRLAILPLLLIAGFAIRYEPVWIPSGSMKPTFLIGDYVLVDRLANTTAQRGKVVAFHHPRNGLLYVGRVIGLPGETVQMRAGIPHVNGTPAIQTPAGRFAEPRGPQGALGTIPRCINLTGPCEKHRLREVWAEGIRYDILDVRATPLDDSTPFVVPRGHLFLLGDNRDNSSDSRMPAARGMGMVPIQALIGPARHVIFSSAGTGLWMVWTWRSNRFFRSVT